MRAMRYIPTAKWIMQMINARDSTLITRTRTVQMYVRVRSTTSLFRLQNTVQCRDF